MVLPFVVAVTHINVPHHEDEEVSSSADTCDANKMVGAAYKRTTARLIQRACKRERGSSTAAGIDRGCIICPVNSVYRGQKSVRSE